MYNSVSFFWIGREERETKKGQRLSDKEGKENVPKSLHSTHIYIETKKC